MRRRDLMAAPDAPAADEAPRWAVVSAHLAALTPLPSAVWRVALALGFTAGYTEQGYDQMDLAGWDGRAYVVVLSVLTEAAALLTLGLVRRWGEVVPSWIPVLGSRRIPPRAVVTAASVGAVVLVPMWGPLLWWWQLPHDDMTTTGADVVGALYLPLVAWGPLLAAVTVSYRRRHRQGQPVAPTTG